jgi:hypothetical protein
VEGNLEVSEIESENKMEAHQEIEEEGMELMPLRRSTRVPQWSTRLRDYTTYKVRYPIQDYISNDNITYEYYIFLTSISKELEPTTYQEAIEKSIWRKAMNEEFKALGRNETWQIVPLPHDKKIVGYK